MAVNKLSDKGEVSHDQFISWIRASIDSKQGEANDARIAQDYYDSNQYTSEELRVLAQRGQKPAIDNRIKPKIDVAMGVEINSRTDPKGLPRTKADEEAAEAMTDAVRFVLDNNDYDKVKTKQVKSYLIKGIGAYFLNVRREGVQGDKNTSENYEIVVKAVTKDNFNYDPTSKDEFFSDAKYLSIDSWIDADDLKVMFSGKDEVIDASVNHVDNSMEFDSESTGCQWVSRDRKRVKVFFINYRHRGVWKEAVFIIGGMLQAPRVSNHYDDKGNPAKTIIAASCYVDGDGDRYGLARQLIPMQDMLNNTLTKTQYSVNANQAFIPSGKSNAEKEAIRRQLNRPDGLIEYDSVTGAPEIIMADQSKSINGNVSLLAHSIQSMNENGVNKSLSGGLTGEHSGVALENRNDTGLLEVSEVFDRQKSLSKTLFENIWWMIKRWWTSERMIRVTDDENKAKFVAINKPITIRQAAIDQYGYVPVQIVEAAAREGKTIDENYRVENDTARINMDIIVDNVPSVINAQKEQMAILMDLLSKAPDKVNPKWIIQNSQIRNKSEVIKEMEESEQQAAQQAQQAQQVQQQQIELQTQAMANQMQGEAAERQTKAQKNIIDTQQAQQALQLDAAQASVDMANVAADTDKKQAETAKTLSEINGGHQVNQPIRP